MPFSFEHLFVSEVKRQKKHYLTVQQRDSTILLDQQKRKPERLFIFLLRADEKGGAIEKTQEIFPARVKLYFMVKLQVFSPARLPPLRRRNEREETNRVPRGAAGPGRETSERVFREDFVILGRIGTRIPFDLAAAAVPISRLDLAREARVFYSFFRGARGWKYCCFQRWSGLLHVAAEPEHHCSALSVCFSLGENSIIHRSGCKSNSEGDDDVTFLFIVDMIKKANVLQPQHPPQGKKQLSCR